MKLIDFALISATLLSGCAGSPVQVANAPGAKALQIGGESMIVSNNGGVWAAGFSDYMAKSIYVDPPGLLRRKILLNRAVEAISGCKVSESTLDPMGITLQATVACVSGASVIQPVATLANSSSTPVALPQPTTVRTAGADTFTAEKYAREQSCNPAPRASLVAKGAGFETYSMACTNGETMVVRCEFGNCRALR